MSEDKINIAGQIHMVYPSQYETEALEDLVLRLSALIEDIPGIAELDFTRVKVMPKGQGYWVVDARIMVR